MPEREVFDDAAASYVATVQSALGASGEAHDFFVQLKATLTREAVAGRDAHDILDFGCGIGLSSRALLRAFPRASVVGVDDSGESIALAEAGVRPGEGLRFVHSRSPRLPFADESFDVAFTACVLHHIAPSERDAWIAELARVVRPGGTVIVFEHNPNNPLTRRVVQRVPFDDGVVLLRAGETRRRLAGAGLSVESPAYYFFFPRWLRGLRPLERWMRWVPVGAQYYVAARRPRGPSGARRAT